MKARKFLSAMIAGMMLIASASFVVSAEAEAAEIKDGAVIEFEDYAGEAYADMYVFTDDESGKDYTRYGTLVETELANGGALLGLGERVGSASMTFTIPVNVTEAGWYDMELLGTSGGDGAWLSIYTLSLGDSTITTSGSAEQAYKCPNPTWDVSGKDANYYYYPICTRETSVYLEQGAQNIVITAIPNTNGTDSSVGVKMALDCLKFSKSVLPEIPAEGGALEFEDYADSIKYTFSESGTNSATVVEQALASGGAVLDMKEKSNITAFDLSMPVVIKQSGWYNMNLIASTSDIANTSVLYIKNGEEEWISNASSYESGDVLYWGKDTESPSYDSDFHWYGIYNHTKLKYIEAGEYTLTASAVAITNNPNATKFVADALVFTPVKTDIPAAGAKLEIEDYAGYFSPWVPEANTMEDTGVTFLFSYGQATVTMRASLNFAKAGYYTMVYRGTPYQNNGLSKTNFYLDDAAAPFMDNDESVSGTALGYDFRDWLPAYEFTKQVYIPAGLHNLKMEIIARNPDPAANNMVAFGADYIELIPLEDSAAVDTAAKTASVTAYYDAPVSGTVITAAYCGKQLIGISTAEKTNVGILESSVSYEGDTAPDTVKVFVWSNLEVIAPLKNVKEFTISG